jgi:2-oxoglutarate ferredoxin oxidoreductase subunit gamma
MAALLLGAAGANDGKFVSGSNVYGAQARGSDCRSEVILSDRPIDFPHLINPDFLIAMSQTTYDLYSTEMRSAESLILYDPGFVTPRAVTTARQLPVTATDYALKNLNNQQMANLVLLGAFIAITGIVSPEGSKKAIIKHIRERFHELNLKAFEAGMRIGRNIHD